MAPAAHCDSCVSGLLRFHSSLGLSIGIKCVTIMGVEVREFLDANGHSPFGKWFNGLDVTAAARVTVAITRLGLGNRSNVKAVGGGVHEYRLDFGPGYRVYFGNDGDTVVILLAGGTKKRQQQDIEVALERWAEYKARKRDEV